MVVVDHHYHHHHHYSLVGDPMGRSRQGDGHDHRTGGVGSRGAWRPGKSSGDRNDRDWNERRYAEREHAGHPGHAAAAVTDR